MTHLEWNEKIQELRSFFADATLPHEPVKIDNFATIVDVELFINLQFKAIEGNVGNYRFQGALEKLIKIKHHLESDRAGRKYN